MANPEPSANLEYNRKNWLSYRYLIILIVATEQVKSND